jgi:hypothetical protein
MVFNFTCLRLNRDLDPPNTINPTDHLTVTPAGLLPKSADSLACRPGPLPATLQQFDYEVARACSQMHGWCVGWVTVRNPFASQ